MMTDIDRAIQVAEERRELAAPLPWRAADGGRVINADHLSILEPVHAFPSNYASAQVAAEDALPLAKALRGLAKIPGFHGAECAGLEVYDEGLIFDASKGCTCELAEAEAALQAWARGVVGEEA